MRLYNPVHGIDYLQDHYSVLGLPRDATLDQINKQFQELIMKVHPDRVHGLDKSIQTQAETKTKALILAHQTLQDPEKRESYDKKFFDFDPNLISDDGTPIMSLVSRRVDIDFLLSGNEYEGKNVIDDHAKELSGYNEGILNILKRVYVENPNDVEVRNAYREMLGKKQAYVTIQEELEWDAAGISNQDDTDRLMSPEDHINQRKKQLDSYRTEIEGEMDRRFIAIQSGEAPMLMAPGESDTELTEENSLALRENLIAETLKNLDGHIGNIEKLAEERAEVLNELTNLTEWYYIPDVQTSYDNLLIFMQMEDKIVFQIPLQLEDNKVNHLDKEYLEIGKGINIDDFLAEENKTKLEQIINSGVNIAVIKYNNDYDIWLQISYVAGQHFGEE